MQVGENIPIFSIRAKSGKQRMMKILIVSVMVCVKALLPISRNSVCGFLRLLHSMPNAVDPMTSVLNRARMSFISTGFASLEPFVRVRTNCSLTSANVWNIYLEKEHNGFAIFVALTTLYFLELCTDNLRLLLMLMIELDLGTDVIYLLDLTRSISW